MVRHGAVAGGRPGCGGARRALRAPGRCRPGPRQKPGRARAPRLPLAGPPARPCGAYACMPRATAHHAMRVSKASSSARKRCSAASGHRAARRTQHRLANNAGRTGAASPALASDTSLLLHRRWHCQTQHAAHGYTTKQARLAFRLQSACRRMLASGSI